MPVTPARATRIQRLYCCAAPAPEGTPPDSLAGTFNVNFAPGASGDGFGVTFTGDLPMTIAAPDAPEGFSIIDNGDGTFAYAYDDVAEGVYEFDIVATNAFGSHAIPTTVTVALPDLWQEFALTTGNILDTYVGYAAALAFGNPEAIGVVGPEPHPVFTARAIVDGGVEGFIVQLNGDCSAVLADKQLTIDGFTLSPSTAAVYIEADDYTNCQFAVEPPPVFVLGQTYYCRFIPADDG